MSALHTALKAKGTTAVISQAVTQAIAGLGGIGKTQTALEYAYLYRKDYGTVFWSTADTEAALIQGFARIAEELNPALKAEPVKEFDKADFAKDWLHANEDWLLILDNVEDAAMVHAFLPPQLSGRLLVTTRLQQLEPLVTVEPLSLPVWGTKESVDFLFDRTKRNRTKAEEQAAQMLATNLYGLPLALEQAAAYIGAKRVSFADYLAAYNTALLNRSQPVMGRYPKTIATTWEINFTAIQAESPASAEVLTAAAFLAPDRIPEKLFRDGAPELGETLAAEHATRGGDSLWIAELLEPIERDSLIRRDTDTNTFDMHRLVQSVRRDSLAEADQRRWAERIINALNAMFPEVKFDNWTECNYLTPHAQICLQWTKFYNIESEAAARLLNQAGVYLEDQGRYHEAELLCVRALEIREHILGDNHSDTAASLNNLAGLYQHQGKLKEAEPLFVRALSAFEHIFGDDHHDTAGILNNLATLYQQIGKWEDAEVLYVRALEAFKKVSGAEHPDTAIALNNLAYLYQLRGMPDKAEPLFVHALNIREHHLEPDHPHISSTISNLAIVYFRQGKLQEAESRFVQALDIFERTLGADHPDTATALNNLGYLYQYQGKLDEAEPLFVRALDIRKRHLPDHPDTANSLSNLADLYRQQGKLKEAEPLMRRAFAIIERVFGPGHPSTTIAREKLDFLLMEFGEVDEGEHTDAPSIG